MLQRLDITALRSIFAARIEPLPGVNLIFGENASGKTSLLEAIHFLSRGRSFRTRTGDHIISRGCEEVVVAGLVIPMGTHGRAVNIGVSRPRKGGLRARIAGCEAGGVADVAELLPVLVMHPESQNLLSGPPSLRRAFLDWGGFYADPDFISVWRRYRRALAQRNSALRRRERTELIGAWNGELCSAAEKIGATRRAVAVALSARLPQLISQLGVGLGEIDISYRDGWREGVSLEEALRRDFERDVRLGCTNSGPHRAELEITVDGQPVSSVVSRGQGKLLASSLIIAIGDVYSTTSGEGEGGKGLLLVDDLFSELDREHGTRMADLLSSLPFQTFITAHTPDQAEDLRIAAMFHVKHGTVKSIPV